jgi:hypothetical protein
MIEQHVCLDAALGAAELGPGKQRQAQRDGGRVQRQQFVLEAELAVTAAERLACRKRASAVKKSSSKQSGGAVLVGI